jgi:MFS family permease
VPFDRIIFRTLLVLAPTQLVGWGTVGLLAVIGRDVAEALGMDIAVVFLGNSVLYVVMGAWAPFLATAFVRHGARRVMLAGTMLAVPGFAMLAFADGPLLYFAAWAVLGTAGSATLTTPAFILLNEIAGRRARGAIGALMLATGLSSSLFWPGAAWLADAVGWRATCLTYAAILAMVNLPLIGFGLPRHVVAPASAAPPTGTAQAASATPGVFALIVSAIALNAFITYGFNAILIELFKARGLSPTEAVGFGAALGLVQVTARGLDFLGGGRWDSIATGVFAGMALPLGMLLLMLGGGAQWSVAAFILIYGLGSGAFAVARATIPLVFYDKADFARASSRIALPLNLVSALSPPVLATLLVRFGSDAVLVLTMLCSLGALACLLRLRRARQATLPSP